VFDPIRRRWIVYWSKRILFWLGSDRPWRMYSHGRFADAGFSPFEILYFRFTARNLDDAGGFRLAAIRFPDQSVNRQKYGKPFDVLVPQPRKLDRGGRSKEWLYCGVAAFPVGCVPDYLEDGKGQVICDFRVEHDPLDYNYAHAEIRAFVEGKRLSGKKGVSRSDRKKFRMKIFEQVTVVVKPLR
jgi:hypothetical protein